jgi:hypothetical protein
LEGELQTLKDFIVEECSLRSPTPSAYGTTTPTDVNWLNIVIFEWNDIDNYTGYWRADFVVDDNGNIVDVDATIVLNVAYLRNLRSLKRVFSHEYGHHWTLSYYAVSQNVNIWDERLPAEYYNRRGINENQYKPDYTNGWHFCDKEVIAEDYRVLFTPFKTNHRMVKTDTPTQLDPPSKEVADFIWCLAKPSGWL